MLKRIRAASCTGRTKGKCAIQSFPWKQGQPWAGSTPVQEAGKERSLPPPGKFTTHTSFLVRTGHAPPIRNPAARPPEDWRLAQLLGASLSSSARQERAGNQGHPLGKGGGKWSLSAGDLTAGDVLGEVAEGSVNVQKSTVTTDKQVTIRNRK